MRWKGLRADVLEAAGVTVDHDGLVHVPYRLRNGRLYSERVVAPTGRRWWRPGDGRPVIPFGLDQLRAGVGRGLIWTEGESDTLAIRTHFACLGFSVLGVPGSGCWRPEWARYADGFEVVYVVPDGDGPGRWLGQKILAAIPSARVAWLMPEGMDARGLIQREGPGALDALLEETDLYYDAQVYSGIHLPAAVAA